MRRPWPTGGGGGCTKNKQNVCQRSLFSQIQRQNFGSLALLQPLIHEEYYRRRYVPIQNVCHFSLIIAINPELKDLKQTPL
jgi:hypothetical protein